jgi:uncharacterized RmlC-like cupin family protein
MRSEQVESNNPTVQCIRPEAEIMTKQRLPYFVGVSKETVGAQGISMNLVVIPPGASPEPHYHKEFETAIYILQGEVETRYGEGLKETMINRKGDFVFIPPGVPHQPYNLSTTEPVMAIVSRNDANEQENVVLYNPRSDSE